MVLASIDFKNPTEITAMIASLIPILLGGVTTYYKIFLEPKKEFLSRISLKRNALIEKFAMRHVSLLNHTRKIENDSLLRGDGHSEPDLVGEYTEELFRLFSIFYRMESLRTIVKFAYGILLITVVLGIIGFVLSILDILRLVVLWYSISAVIVQVFTILGVYLASNNLEQYEDVT